MLVVEVYFDIVPTEAITFSMKRLVDIADKMDKEAECELGISEGFGFYVRETVCLESMGLDMVLWVFRGSSLLGTRLASTDGVFIL